MTDLDTHDQDAIAGFYDALAADYDAMTGFAGRFDRERPHLARLVERSAIRTAVDAGSGTGFHALLLAELGVEVTAVDLSERMIQRTAQHAHERGLRVRTAVGDITRLEELALPRVDAVFSLGNTLAHLENSEALEKAAGSFAGTLKPGGLLVVQTLNYDRILSRRETIQSVRESGGATFVRFYEFLGERVRFNILRIWKEGGVLRHSHQTTLLTPFGRDEIRSTFERNGFVDIVESGSMALDPFVPGESGDLVLLARRAR